MLKPSVESLARRLVLGRKKHVSGEFADLWLLCYPEDGEVRQLVEREIDRMVERASEKGTPITDEE
jgi:hypothetical protein